MNALILDSGAVTSLARRDRPSAAAIHKADTGEPLATEAGASINSRCCHRSRRG